MPFPKEINQILKENNGTFTTSQANQVGISNERLRLLVKSGELNRVSFGVYSTPDEFIDKMFIACQRCRNIIYSHETALFLHNLTDREPLKYTVTVPSGYNTSRLKQQGFTAFSIKREYHRLGVIETKTMFGNPVKTYNLERTICDCLRNRNKMDIAILTYTVKQYVKRRDKDLNQLMKMAEIFQVTKPLQSYLEVLL